MGTSNPAMMTRGTMDALYAVQFSKARETNATVRHETHFGTPCEIVTVHGALGVPGLVGKTFGRNTGGKGVFTAGGFRPALETPDSVFHRTGADIVINGSGYVVDPTDPRDGLIEGAQICGGVVYNQFNPPTANRGTDALGFRADGTAKVYSSKLGDTVESMLADGVVDSFSFGPALMIAGVKSNITGTGISARQILGTTPDGNIIIVSTAGASNVSGITYPQAADLAQMIGMDNAVGLDGGGSVQTMANGQWVHPSSDSGGPRPVPDFLTIRARVIGETGTSWAPLTPENDFKQHSTPAAVRVRDGKALLCGAVIHGTATGVVRAAVLPWWARPVTYQRFGATVNVNNSQYYDVAPNGDLLLSSSIASVSPRYLSVINYPVR